MPKQPAFPGLRDAMKKKVTRREQFLAEMDAVVPWGRLLALLEPHYPKVGPKGGKVWGVMRKAPKGGDLHPIDARINRIIAMVRAKVEHPFRVVQRQLGHVKTRYRGLAKNRAQLFTLFALGNLFLVRRRLMV